MYLFHGSVGVSEEVLRSQKEDVVARKNVEPANDVKVVKTETNSWTFAGYLWSIANTWREWRRERERERERERKRERSSPYICT